MDSEVMLHKLEEIMAVPIADLPPDYPFKPSVPEVPILSRYDCPAPDSFWDEFPKDRNIHKGSPFVIDTDALRGWVDKSNPSTTTEVLMEEVIKDVEHGADLALKEVYDKIKECKVGGREGETCHRYDSPGREDRDILWSIQGLSQDGDSELDPSGPEAPGEG